jgi:hypothetical protein
VLYEVVLIQGPVWFASSVVMSVSSVPVIAAEFGSIVAVGRSGAFQILVGPKKRNGVLVPVPVAEVVTGGDAVLVVVMGAGGAVGAGEAGALTGLLEGRDVGAMGELGTTGLDEATGAAGVAGVPAVVGRGVVTGAGLPVCATLEVFVRCAGVVP